MWHQSEIIEFSPTWSCVSLTRSSTSSGWKFRLNNLAVKGLRIVYYVDLEWQNFFNRNWYSPRDNVACCSNVRPTSYNVVLALAQPITLAGTPSWEIPHTFWWLSCTHGAVRSAIDLDDRSHLQMCVPAWVEKRHLSWTYCQEFGPAVTHNTIRFTMKVFAICSPVRLNKIGFFMWEMKWNESGFRPPLCTCRLNWARRTSWGWWDEWDDTVLQTQDSNFEPWRSEAEHATSRSRRLPTILTMWDTIYICMAKTG